MNIDKSIGIMALQEVRCSADVYLVCLTHAMCTEKEEVMGLLIGEVDASRVAHISSVIILRRSDKQPDRVEISPEQLTRAAEKAEAVGKRVIGWYHSHPHITVWPSHVDVRTQALYQMMDERFVGIIFSVFNQDTKTLVNRIQVTCFQSINQSPEGEPPQYMRAEVSLHITPSDCISKNCLNALVELPKILSAEEQEAYFRTTNCKNLDLVTQIHNGAVFSKSQCQLMEVVTGPMVHSLELRLAQNRNTIERLKARKNELEAQLRKTGQWSPKKTTPV